jgi:signal transduction histidine kinase
LPEEAVTVCGNRARLQRVITNLLDNAIKFTPARGRVTCTLSHRDGHVDVTVRDTGVGIPPEEHERVFDRFYRRDPSRNVTGNGLGLCLARSIVHAHDGQIRLASAVDEGSCFTVRLPLQPDSQSADA